jgi:mannose/fructose/N-acetylgalactosamine-specific phosphotransferase system component IIB
MKTVLVRIDDRLIHGQVVVGWVRSNDVTCILVVDDKIAKDKVQCSLLRMATPVGVKAEILTLEDAVEKIKADAFKGENVMILARGPQTILDLINRGIEIPSVNIGNVRSMEGRNELVRHVYATPDEVKLWQELDKKNVKMSAQILPDQPKADLNGALKNMG